MQAQAQAEHEWLRGLVGEWEYVHYAIEADGSRKEAMRGTESVRALGDLWVLCEAEGTMSDGNAGRSIMTLGYDPAKQQFVGTFIGSTMTELWIYHGQRQGNRLMLDTEGPSFAGDGRTLDYQDVIELDGPDRRALVSHMHVDEGWIQFMRAEYRRVG